MYSLIAPSVSWLPLAARRKMCQALLLRLFFLSSSTSPPSPWGGPYTVTGKDVDAPKTVIDRMMTRRKHSFKVPKTTSTHPKCCKTMRKHKLSHHIANTMKVLKYGEIPSLLMR